MMAEPSKRKELFDLWSACYHPDVNVGDFSFIGDLMITHLESTGFSVHQQVSACVGVCWLQRE